MTGETEAARLPKLSLGNIVDQGWKGGERKRWRLWSLSPNPQAIHEPWTGSCCFLLTESSPMLKSVLLLLLRRLSYKDYSVGHANLSCMAGRVYTARLPLIHSCVIE